MTPKAPEPLPGKEKLAERVEKFNRPPTLLELECDQLAREQGNLINMRHAVQRQEEKINNIRVNIGLLEDHPWVEALFKELREREKPPGVS
jgi:hypothetical protein